jgi:hypothetical protein
LDPASDAEGQEARRRARRALALTAALICAHVALAYALDALGLIERLLAPAPGPATLAALGAALLFYGVRFLLLFVMPGLVLSALLYGYAGGACGRQRPRPRLAETQKRPPEEVARSTKVVERDALWQSPPAESHPRALGRGHTRP